MKKITFDEEELFVIAVFNVKTREKAVSEMEAVIAELAEDPEMQALLVSTKEKLKRISDGEFSKLDLESYLSDLTDDAAYDDDNTLTDEEAPKTDTSDKNSIADPDRKTDK